MIAARANVAVTHKLHKVVWVVRFCGARQLWQFWELEITSDDPVDSIDNEQFAEIENPPSSAVVQTGTNNQYLRKAQKTQSYNVAFRDWALDTENLLSNRRYT